MGLLASWPLSSFGRTGLSAIAFHTLFDCVGVGVTLIGGAWKSSSSHSDLDEFSNGAYQYFVLFHF